MATIELEATVRPGVGKGAARQARRDGQVPGVIYGGNEDPVSINVHQPALLKRLKAGQFLSTLIDLTVDGKTQSVICRNVQRDVVKDLPIHVDFLRLSPNSRIKLMIPVSFVNEDVSPGLKKGGVLTVVRNEVELNVLAGDIPDQIEVDLAEVQIGDTISISAVTLPEGAKPVIDRDFVIANISAPRALASDDEDEGEGEVAADEVPTAGDEEAAEE